MSQIKSSDDHLVLNAEGTAKDTKIQANGTDLVTIKSGGNIGIGTSNPTQRLHASAPSSPALLENSGGGDYQLDLKTSGATYNARIGVNTGNNFIFNCNNSEKLRIQSGGGISFNGDTAAANALDDYEEGTWSIELFDAASGGNKSTTAQTGYYTKIGNIVTAHISIFNISTTGLTAGNTFYISLPYTVSSSSYTAGSISLDSFGLRSRPAPAFALQPNSIRAYIRVTGEGLTDAGLRWSEVTDGVSDIVAGTVVFKTD